MNTHKKIKPPALSENDQVMLIAPGHAIHEQQLSEAIDRLKVMQLRVKTANNMLDRYGYFAGSIEKRAEDINHAFADPDIKAIIAVRGGSGCSLLLDHLDYDLIEKNPKILLGLSDVTALLIGIYEKTGLITFHGPGAGMEWPQYSVNYIKSLLFKRECPTYRNPDGHVDDLIEHPCEIRILQRGQAQGEILGGNLTVLTTLMGTPYFPKDWKNKILFVEEIGEAVYRIDRMFAQLKIAGILSQISGFIGGTFLNATKNSPSGFDLNDVLERYLKPLKIPAFYGAMIGHQPQNMTIAQGVEISMDADLGEFHSLSNAVS